jgi:hypothetical protein
MRLGVTGHRSLEHLAEVRREVNIAIDQACEAYVDRDGPIALVVVSALAEGADRLVVKECMRRAGTTLEAILPLSVEEYTQDFLTPRSRRDFAGLLGTAISVEVVESMPTRDQAYERAGHVMVDRSDVVVAVWDGLAARGRGGTADIVDYAQAHHVPVIHVDSRRGRT